VFDRRIVVRHANTLEGDDVRKTTWHLVVLLVALVLTAAGCGDDDEEPAGGGAEAESAQPTTLKVGVIPIADVAPLYLGMKQGFFEEEGLTIEPALAEGGAAIVPAVISGDNQIGFSNTTSLIIAASKNLPIQIISQGVQGGTGEDDAWDAVLVPKGSDIKSAEDLAGKTIAVNTLNNVGPLTINTALEKRGIDFKGIKYVEVPFPDMNAALETGRVDAAWVVEPFYSQGLGADSKALLHPYEETTENLTVATYFASKQYIAENRDVVDRFVRAMGQSLQYASENPDAVREIVTEYTQIPPEAAESMHLPVWSEDLGEATIQETIDLAAQYEFVEEPPSLDDLILR
jgi:NitT/TauT family transport system substrate-binding protein